MSDKIKLLNKNKSNKQKIKVINLHVDCNIYIIQSASKLNNEVLSIYCINRNIKNINRNIKKIYMDKLYIQTLRFVNKNIV